MYTYIYIYIYTYTSSSILGIPQVQGPARQRRAPAGRRAGSQYVVAQHVYKLVIRSRYCMYVLLIVDNVSLSLSLYIYIYIHIYVYTIGLFTYLSNAGVLPTWRIV